MKGTLNDQVKGGIYLVVDPSMPQALLFSKLDQVLKVGIDILQIWDHWLVGVDKGEIITKICERCHDCQVPVIINNHWELLNSFPLDGVHFDTIPEDYGAIERTIEKPFLVGLTCSNSLVEVAWAERNAFDYISFCSMFPSTTSTSCTLVSFETVTETRKLTTMPIFLAGGITLPNMKKLTSLDFDGIALVSGIMSVENPAKATIDYVEKLTEIKDNYVKKIS